MNWNHKPCQQCSRTMAADDAHLRCQKCRNGDEWPKGGERRRLWQIADRAANGRREARS